MATTEQSACIKGGCHYFQRTFLALWLVEFTDVAPMDDAAGGLYFSLSVVCGWLLVDWMLCGEIKVTFFVPFVRATFFCPSCMLLYLVLQNFHQEDFIST